MFTGREHDHPVLQYPPPEMQRKWKSNVELAPSCPRCTSPNTKFCYYNNYSLSQPRYFCKGCRRYWTKGGLLRNVPVGRGCRKNRRAKSSRRISENSVNQSKTFGTFDDSRNDQITNCESSVGANGGSVIDLAVVFAKFLNPSSSSEPEFASREMANNSSNFSTPETVKINDGMLMKSQNPSDHHLVMGNGNLHEEFPQVFDVGEKLLQEDDQRVQDLLENDMNAYGLETLFSADHEIEQDVLWSDAAAFATRPNFTWQPMFQLQDFDSFPADGQLKTSASLTSDNWNSYDLSGFDVYSRPLI